MGTKRRMEINIETERVMVITPHNRNLMAWCAGCDALVLMLTVDEAASLIRATSRAICRQVEAGQLHYTEPPDGLLLICLASLLQSVATGPATCENSDCASQHADRSKEQVLTISRA